MTEYPKCVECNTTEDSLNTEGRQLYVCDLCGCDVCSTCSEDGPGGDVEVVCTFCAEEAGLD